MNTKRIPNHTYLNHYLPINNIEDNSSALEALLDTINYLNQVELFTYFFILYLIFLIYIRTAHLNKLTNLIEKYMPN